jgi:hypothetical protein
MWNEPGRLHLDGNRRTERLPITCYAIRRMTMPSRDFAQLNATASCDRSGPARDGTPDCAPGWHVGVGRRPVATALLRAAWPPIPAGVTATRSPTGQRRRRRGRPSALVDVAVHHDGRYAHLRSPSRFRSPSGLAGCTAPLGFTPLGRHRRHPEAHGRVQLQPAPGCDHGRSHAVR